MSCFVGLQDDTEAIEGLDEAWKDPEHPVHVCKDHPSWRSGDHKYQKYHYNFNHGDAIFCIPPYPFRGESKHLSKRFLLIERWGEKILFKRDLES